LRLVFEDFIGQRPMPASDAGIAVDSFGKLQRFNSASIDTLD
jgi:hypothetical protein